MQQLKASVYWDGCSNESAAEVRRDPAMRDTFNSHTFGLRSVSIVAFVVVLSYTQKADTAARSHYHRDFFMALWE